MEEPPVLMDGARVLQFALLDAAAAPMGRYSAVVEGVAIDQDQVSRLVIAENLAESGVFLMHCNDDWETVAAGQYPDAKAAESSVVAAYAGIKAKWTMFHDLSPEEEHEVETTRSFLRELAAENPEE